MQIAVHRWCSRPTVSSRMQPSPPPSSTAPHVCLSPQQPLIHFLSPGSSCSGLFIQMELHSMCALCAWVCHSALFSRSFHVVAGVSAPPFMAESHLWYTQATFYLPVLHSWWTLSGVPLLAVINSAVWTCVFISLGYTPGSYRSWQLTSSSGRCYK